MRVRSALLTLTLVVPALHAQGDSLSVLAHAPGDTAESGNVVRVIFDRPVAGRLGASVDPSRHFRIVPAVAGKLSWRDPITMQFVPAQPFAPGDSFTVTIDTTLYAIDGTHLAQAYRFTFRVPGARLLFRSFGANYGNTTGTLPLDGRIQLLFSAPVDLEALSHGSRLVLTRCFSGGDPAIVAIRAIRQRAVRDSDPYEWSNYGQWDRDTTADHFHRVVELEADRPLPEDCAGELELPTTSADSQFGPVEKYAVKTPRPFRADTLACLIAIHCSPDGLRLVFSAPVSAEELRRHVHIVSDSAPVLGGEWQDHGDAAAWVLRVRLEPRVTYTAVIDSSLRAVTGRLIRPPLRLRLSMGDRLPAITYAFGILMTPRAPAASIPMYHVNVRAIRRISYSIPDSMRWRALAMGRYYWVTQARLDSLGVRPDTSIISVAGTLNAEVSTDIPLPTARHQAGAMRIVRLEIATVLDAYPEKDSAAWGITREGTKLVATNANWPNDFDWALIQETDLAIDAKLGAAGGTVLVTGLSDGGGRGGASLRFRDAKGAVLATGTTDSAGMFTIASSALASLGSVEAIYGDDRVVLGLIPRLIGFDVDALHPRNLGVSMETVRSMHGAIFADRGIYRPSEMVYLKGIVREGTLSTLGVPAPRSVRIRLTATNDRWGDDGFAMHDTVIAPNAFGTVTDSLRLRAGIPLGQYDVELQVIESGAWHTIASDSLRIAEYRAPEFLVEARADSAPLYGADTLRVDATGRFLFGAPMGRAKVFWFATLHEARPWEIRIPGAEGWTVGEWAWSRRGDEVEPAPVRTGGADSLDAQGRVSLHVPLAALKASRPGRVDVQVAVADVNRQMVSAAVSVPVHPARLYLLVKPRQPSPWWTAGERGTIDIRAVRPDGTPVPEASVMVSVTRPSWYGNRADSTLHSDTVRVSNAAGSFAWTPASGGIFELHFSATDGHGGEARTSLTTYVIANGAGWWARDPVRLALVVDPSEASVGGRVAVSFDSPFDSADAWVTVEREGILDQRIIAVRRGANTLPLYVREAHVPGVYVSVLLLRRGDLRARPDSALQRFRVGYAELQVNSSPKRLSVSVVPESAAYRPGDSVRVHVRVRDAAGHGVAADVTLWAVDEGVLSLTAYATPDIVRRIYELSGVGSRLWSTLPNLLTNDTWLRIQSRTSPLRLGEVVVSGEGFRVFTLPDAPLRKDFRTTAFYAGGVAVDSSGDADVGARLPDNITTYRVMAVAVSGGDRFGSGDAPLLATRPLVVRPSLPRFVRAGDSMFAGAVVNVRDGKTRAATVDVASEGLRVTGASRRVVALRAGQGAEARFHFVAPSREKAPDHVTVRFHANDKTNADAVETRLPVSPDFHVRTHTIMGAVRDSADLVMELPAGTDPARSRLTLRFGGSPLTPMLAATEWLRNYPFDCTEQVASVGRALIAVARMRRGRGDGPLDGATRALVQGYADKLARRQERDGSISYWSGTEWSSPWLTAYAGEFLLDAKAEGVVVDPGVLSSAAEYLRKSLPRTFNAGGENRYAQRDNRLALGSDLAAVEFLRRAGEPDAGAENELLSLANKMTWEDRLRLAELLATRPDLHAAAEAIVDTAWRTVKNAGARVDLPDSSLTVRDFPSHIAPAARLLTATVALRAGEPRLGALVETILQTGAAERRWVWSTQDYSSMVVALAAFAGEAAAPRALRVSAGGRALFTIDSAARDTAVSAPLGASFVRGKNGKAELRVRVTAAPGRGIIYYALSVSEVPQKAPVTPDMRGILVERWYERMSDGRPVISAREGDLVRVRLRITVPTDREFVALEDPVPAGLEPVDLSLRTASTLDPFIVHELNPDSEFEEIRREHNEGPRWQRWLYGNWDEGWWQPWDHKELRDDRVIYFARMLWKGSYSASYIARATSAGTFIRPPAHAEEMYNAALSGRSDGGRFTIAAGTP